MNCFILTESDFFRQINNDSPCGEQLKTAYNGFVSQVIALCKENDDLQEALFSMTYMEIELQYHQTVIDLSHAGSELGLYIRKALAFLQKTVKFFSDQVLPSTPASIPALQHTAAETPPLQWTGNAIDLVEMIYGINEMRCINGGKIPLKQLAPILYSFFGVDSKDCYRFYTDIKRRKNDSRTYFLDKMQEKLNEKMRRDEELERMRR